MEDILHGFDVLPSAVHLTASTLALLAPEISFQKMQLYSLPLGKLQDMKIYLGSIEYLHSDRVETQLDLMGEVAAQGAAAATTGRGTSPSVAPVPPLDLCVMNPPFVRSVNSNLLFGSLPHWRREMQQELARRLRSKPGREVRASTTAGLASIFTAIGDRHLKPNGRLALVLPAAITSGGAWAKTRNLIDHGYDLEYLVASHDSSRWAFSENTELSEVLLVARKRERIEGRERNDTAACVFINLWRNPSAIADALALGESVGTLPPAPVGSPKEPAHGVTSVHIGSEKWGEMVQIPLRALNGQPWLGSAFAQTELVRLNWHLRQGSMVLPGSPHAHKLPLCRLDRLAELGPDGRDIHDGFTQSRSRTNYPAFWNHDADTVVSITQEPNLYLLPRTSPAAGRPKRPVSLLMPRAAKVMVAVRLRFNTHRLTAVRVDVPALSNVWYPVKLRSDTPEHEKALLLWLKSTLGVLLIAGHRVPTQGAWVQFKKPTWNPMPVLDVMALPRQQLRSLATAFDSVADEELAPLSQMDADPIRQELDDALCHALDLPSLAPVRSLLAREPVITDRALWIFGEPEKQEEVSEQFELLLPAK
jgi:hypothetical protein